MSPKQNVTTLAYVIAAAYVSLLICLELQWYCTMTQAITTQKFTFLKMLMLGKFVTLKVFAAFFFFKYLVGKFLRGLVYRGFSRCGFRFGVLPQCLSKMRNGNLHSDVWMSFHGQRVNICCIFPLTQYTVSC